MQQHFPELHEQRRREAEQRLSHYIRVEIGNRFCRNLTLTNGVDSASTPLSYSLTLFAEIIAPPRFSHLDGGDLGAMLIDTVRFALPIELASAIRTRTLASAGPKADRPGWLEDISEDGILDAQMFPFQVSFEVSTSDLEHVLDQNVAIVIIWQRRLKLEPFVIDHSICGDDGGASGQHEVPLGRGLTIERVVERCQPKARVGVGSVLERRVY